MATQNANHSGLIIGLVVAGILLFGAGVAVGAAIGHPSLSATSSAGAAPSSTDVPAPTTPEETTPEAPSESTYTAPAATDFKLTLKVLSKQCFGSAGCNLTYRILVSYAGPTLNPATTYDVLYTVKGGEDGPITNTLKVTGDQSSVDEEESASTKHKADKLTVAVTDVLG
jgi:hypothetical protein